MTTTLANPTPDPETVDPAALDLLAFERTASVRSTMKAENCPHYTLDAFYAAGKALWAVPRVKSHRDDLLTLPKYDIGYFDRFEDYACALRFVQTEILRRIQRAKQLPEVAAEGWRIRSMMMSYAEALSFKGHIAPELIVRLREGSGYRDLVEDLTVLVREFKSLPEGRTGLDAPVTGEDLTRASQIAQRINIHVGNAVDPEVSHETLLAERRKLGALLLEAHSQIRRGITFFRWDEGDVNTLLPSLYVPPSGRKTTDPTVAVPDDLAALHEQLHAAQAAETPAVVHPEDHPFAAE